MTFFRYVVLCSPSVRSHGQQQRLAPTVVYYFRKIDNMEQSIKLKTALIIIAVLTINLVVGQNLPILKLTETLNSATQVKCPITLTKNEICVSLVLSGGMTAHNYYTHYIFQENGNVIGIREELPKSYLKNRNFINKSETMKLDEKAKLKLVRILNSTENLKFIKFSQSDFYKPKIVSKFQPPCVSDAAGYSLSFIQNNRQKIYSFYAPEYYYSNKCKDENLNKTVLSNFVELLQIWGIME